MENICTKIHTHAASAHEHLHHSAGWGIKLFHNRVLLSLSLPVRQLRNTLPDALRSICKKIFSRDVSFMIRLTRSRFSENAAVLINFAPVAQNLKCRRFQESCLENMFLQILPKADVEYSFAIPYHFLFIRMVVL